MGCYYCGLSRRTIPDIGLCTNTSCQKLACGFFNYCHGEDCEHCSKFLCYRHQHIHAFKNNISPFASFPKTRDKALEIISTYATEPNIERRTLAYEHRIYFAKMKDAKMEKAFSDIEKVEITSPQNRSFFLTIMPSLLDVRSLLAKSIMSKSEYIGIDKEMAMSKLLLRKEQQEKIGKPGASIIVWKQKGFTEEFSAQKMAKSLMNSGTPECISIQIPNLIQRSLIKPDDLIIPIRSSELKELAICELKNRGMIDIAKSYSMKSGR
jgi:hypothetical protein